MGEIPECRTRPFIVTEGFRQKGDKCNSAEIQVNPPVKLVGTLVSAETFSLIKAQMIKNLRLKNLLTYSVKAMSNWSKYSQLKLNK
ncbi:hypothetical protein CONCODRAFT_5985 [Conidiobolus coronatus NRRL 28638]|uniref:Uncharacterized protein n=1 Tax=Conidiobolus coronatus (strain ATCC 28846 / CBS 209.66 / NRRL 28638) TaxID=796925 RepID=A0A137P8L2_CONC2|nr:hypothetical protein CONCODRAFT_5985 [Conidiobolus coronatus NRRL 28638]|eukprot:KXN71345.1 hypothetical protein CONCODRAFT_5985 [Conidiobolus coronatus NRRL 28638]